MERAYRNVGPLTTPPADAFVSTRIACLSHLTQDAYDRRATLTALRTRLPPRPPRHAKTSSERGRAFRERQLRKEEALEHAVVELEREIAQLDMHRTAWQARCLNRRWSPTGSLVQLTYEYHRLFAHGLESDPQRAHVTYEGMGGGHRQYTVLLQEAFLRRCFDETAIVGNMVGPDASIVQWRRYRQSHEDFTIDGTRIEISESNTALDDDEEEAVVSVTAHCCVHGRLSAKTFAMLFPHARNKKALLDRLIGTEVTYPASRRLQFTCDGRIAVETVDVDFVAGLQRAGISLQDVAMLLQGSAVTRDSMIVEVEPPPAHAKRLGPPSGSWDATAA